VWNFLLNGKRLGVAGLILAIGFLGSEIFSGVYAQEEDDSNQGEEEAAEPFVPPTYGYKQLTFHDGPHCDTEPCVSPDGTTVGFVRNLLEERGCMICTVPSEGGEVVSLVDLKRGQALGLSWSPDGQHLFFGYARRGKNGKVTDIRQILAKAGEKPEGYQGRSAPPVGRHPSVSKDGKLAYVHRNNVVVEMGGEDQVYLTRSGYQEYPEWSSDGKWLVYHSSPGLAMQDSFKEDATIVRLEITKGTEEEGWCSHPRFSPDAKDLVCVGLRGQQYDVWVMPREDIDPYPVTQDAFMELGADWLQNRTIVFSSNRSGDFDLWLAIEGFEEEAPAEEGDDLEAQEEEGSDQMDSEEVEEPVSETPNSEE